MPGRGLIVKSDALNLLKALPAATADIVFLDPPFNLGKRYGRRRAKSDAMGTTEYELYMNSVMNEAVRILAPGGTLYLYHLPKWALVFGATLQTQLELRHWIAISMKNGFMRGRKRLYPAHYALLMFSRGTPAHFHRPKTKIQTCRHCGEDVKDYGGYRRYLRSGINLTDFWDDISPVRHKKFKSRKANELPTRLTDRVALISGFKSGLIVDPFAGTGSVVLAAARRGMRFVAGDREFTQFRLLERRLTTISNQ